VNLALVYGLYLLLAALCIGAWSVRSVLVRIKTPTFVLPLALVAIVAGVPALRGAPADGLEYEDAYIHKSAARYQLFDALEPTAGFFVKACIVGSIASCLISGSFGTHPIAYSALISGVARVFGYSPFLGNVVSVVCWIATAGCFWCILGTYVRSAFSRLLGMVLLLGAPTMYVIGGTAFAEPLFGLLLMLCIWQFLSRPQTEQPIRTCICRVGLWAISLLLLELSKKEGLLFLA